MDSDNVCVDHKTTSKSESEENFIFSMVTVLCHIIFIHTVFIVIYIRFNFQHEPVNERVQTHRADRVTVRVIPTDRGWFRYNVRDNGSRTHRKGVYLVPKFSHDMYICIYTIGIYPSPYAI